MDNYISTLIIKFASPCNLKKHNVKCGVSIDGNFHHNKFRVFHNGKSTYEDTIKGYNLLNQNNLVAGILCVVDFETNPEEVLDSLCSLDPRQLDLLQPFIHIIFKCLSKPIIKKFT